VPQERARLLGLAQRAVNNGHTRAVIFLSGDQHWGELLAKRMPDSPEFGPAQVTARKERQELARCCTR
jgi:alkaline phosphatase D